MAFFFWPVQRGADDVLGEDWLGKVVVPAGLGIALQRRRDRCPAFFSAAIGCLVTRRHAFASGAMTFRWP
ncbi:hypothetical protein OR60_16250 [Xanthomonas vesicatoria]|uniref:Uncharacterized protein n=1 Tax=Xanthomonas vesicatoria TaxID=56460 RepID=A0AAJ0IZ22_9XANT|nr:hypothetical protein BI313_17345 [Xanthomonas vesicatoria]KHM92598.1 hypothetical protein OR60_16250 [Xanthomonas vesicatoria]KHM95101.1 hypothetical protein OR61_09750 [Xanthomonas vesicatoria]